MFLTYFSVKIQLNSVNLQLKSIVRSGFVWSLTSFAKVGGTSAHFVRSITSG